MRDLDYNWVDVTKYSLWRTVWPRVHQWQAFLGELVGGIAGAVSGALTTAGSIASTVGAAGVGAAGAAGSAAIGTAGAIGGAAISGVTSVVGGLGTLATAAKPAAELFGAVYGTMSSIEQAKVQKRAQALAEKQYASSAQISQEALQLRGTQSPIETMADLMLGQGAAATGEAAQGGAEKAGVIEQLGPYLPLLAIGLVGILLLRGRK
jgi:hypothetical protein